MMTALLLLLVALCVLGGLAILTSRGSVDTAVARRERAELYALRSLIDDLKDTAYDHRELDSALSVIVIDKIREHERRIRRELGP